MRPNLLRFGDWMEAMEKDKPEKVSMDQWGRQEIGVSDKDMADLGGVVMVNKVMKPMGSKGSIPYRRATVFSLKSDKDGKTFKLKDLGEKDPSDPLRAAFPHAAPSTHYGKKYTLSRDEYESGFLKFPPKPAGPGI